MASQHPKGPNDETVLQRLWTMAEGENPPLGRPDHVPAVLSPLHVELPPGGQTAEEAPRRLAGLAVRLNPGTAGPGRHAATQAPLPRMSRPLRNP